MFRIPIELWNRIKSLAEDIGGGIAVPDSTKVGVAALERGLTELEGEIVQQRRRRRA